MNEKSNHGNIELQINELVLHGFPHHQCHRIGEAIRRELLRQLTVSGIPDSLTRQVDIGQLHAQPIRVAVTERPERIGQHVARSVFGSISINEQSLNHRPASASRQGSLINNTGVKKS